MLEMLSGEENPTPIVRLNRVLPHKQAKIYAKLEWYNPFGSVKDRVAHNLIRDADEKGLLGDGQQLVEPTSGNTGMGLAMIANAKGYKLTTPLSNKIPVEKRVMLNFFGSHVEELDDDL
jgi:cysteine synthase